MSRWMTFFLCNVASAEASWSLNLARVLGSELPLPSFSQHSSDDTQTWRDLRFFLSLSMVEFQHEQPYKKT